MKRILVLVITISAVLSVTAHARSCHYGNRYRVRWSPYTHGLVYGDIKYSPYAFKRGSSGMVYSRLRYSPYVRGLVHESVRYSPYAFGFKKSGLVFDPWTKSYDYYYARPCQKICNIVYKNSNRSSSLSVKRKPDCCSRSVNNCCTGSTVRKTKTENPRHRRNRHLEQRQLDGRDVITAYLNLMRIDFRTNRILSIERNLISIDFILTDRNIVIKYWNPDAILTLKRQNNRRIAYYENYLESYKEYCSEYQNNGGKIYQIITADNKEVLTKLLDCDMLNAKQKTEGTTVVAKADEESAVQETAN